MQDIADSIKARINSIDPDAVAKSMMAGIETATSARWEAAVARAAALPDGIRPEKLNAVNGAMRAALDAAWTQFREDDDAWVGIVTGNGRAFCAGADLKAISTGGGNPVKSDGDFGPMGCTRLRLSKPVIAAIEGPAVAGGLEVACWADLRVAAEGATAAPGAAPRPRQRCRA